MAELYDKKSTDASKAELIKFAKFCKQKFKHTSIIIGGWAVYAFAKNEQSIDIDVVFGSKKQAQIIMRRFFKENGYKIEEHHDQQIHFVKEIKKGQKMVQLRFDYFSFEDNNGLAENPKIKIPFKLIKENFEYKKFGAAKIRVPSVELLLLFKVKALRDRDNAINLRGIRIFPEQRLWLKSKIAKDKRDIRALIKTGKIRSQLLEGLLEKTRFKKYFDSAMKEIEAG